MDGIVMRERFLVGMIWQIAIKMRRFMVIAIDARDDMEMDLLGDVVAWMRMLIAVRVRYLGLGKTTYFCVF